ncbi:glycosyltransferase family 52 [Providencia hangzhouensis]
MAQLDNFIINREIQYYIPHPRDLTNYFSDIEYKFTSISGRYHNNLIEQGAFVEIYGFFSTTQFILSSSDAVKNYTFRFASMDNGFERLESALAQHAVNFITVDISK